MSKHEHRFEPYWRCEYRNAASTLLRLRCSHLGRWVYVCRCGEPGYPIPSPIPRAS